jgi:hypothetical protein
MNKTYVDPPFGWKYGFPKFYINRPENFNQWLLDNGYPQAEINQWVEQIVPCRMWIEESFCNKEMCTEHFQCASEADNQGLSEIEKEEPELIITSPCGDKYKWNYQTRNWDNA